MNPKARHTFASVIFAVCLAALGCQTSRLASRKENDSPNKLTPSKEAEIQIALGRSLESQGDFAKAEAIYREAIKRDPKRAEASIRMAVLLDRTGRFAEAAPFYAAALKAEPGNAEIYCDRGYSLALQGKNSEAETTLRQAIVKAPKLARAHNNLGLLLGRKGQSEEALAEFRKAGCPEVDAHLNLAFALCESQRWTDAKDQVQIAKSLGEGEPAVVEGTTEIETMIARAEAPRAITAGRDGSVLQAGANAGSGGK
jgi:Tfp pilus assembly protein PilF